MASPSFLNVAPSVQQRQSAALQAEVSNRVEQGADRRKLVDLLEKTATEIQEKNQYGGELIERLQQKHISASEPNSGAVVDFIQIFSKLIQFTTELQEVGSIETTYTELSALGEKARDLESVQAELEAEIKYVQEAKARVLELLREKQEKIRLAKEANAKADGILKR